MYGYSMRFPDDCSSDSQTDIGHPTARPTTPMGIKKKIRLMQCRRTGRVFKRRPRLLHMQKPGI